MRGALLLACLLAPAAAMADRPLPAPPPLVKEECGACHVPYSAALLPPESWARLMGGLDRHFGTDASVDPRLAKQIADWLAANAGGKRAQVAPPEDRITRAAWFERKHRKVASSAWTLPSVKGASNCAACHPGSPQGDFNERDLRVPR